MPKRDEQEPTLIRQDDHGDVFEHPAFAMIGAYRTQGGSFNLYGSDFVHNHTVTVRIVASTMRRTLSNDWHHGGRELIEVSLSEAQWATFVTAMNVGHGVPCTLQHLQGEHMPAITRRDIKEVFESEVHEATEKARIALEDLQCTIASTPGISKAKQAELMAKAATAGKALNSTIPWVEKQFRENMEHNVEKAKSEVHGYITSSLMRAGLDALNPPIHSEPPQITETKALPAPERKSTVRIIKKAKS